MTAPKIKLGLVGTGHMGQYHVNVVVGLNEYKVVGIHDVDPARSEEIGKRFGVNSYDNLDRLIDAVDALVIAVPTVFHYDTALRCLNAGKHVLVEKPMTQSVEQARKLVDIAFNKNLILQVGHVERFNGAVMELNKIIDKPLLIESRRLAPFNPRIGDVGVVLDLMIHDLDIVLNMMGNDKIKSVHASGTKAFSEHEDIAVATIQFESGCIANLNASRATQNKVRTLIISQEKAYIILDFSTQDIDIHRQATSAYLMTREELKYKQESFVEKIYVHKDNPLRQEHLHFINCIKGTATPIVDGQTDILTLEIANRILSQIKL